MLLSPTEELPVERWRSKMKTMIATLALVLLAAGPTFAASLHIRPLPEGPTFVPQSGYYGGAATSTSREGLVRSLGN
jgi:hypothetical protein